MSNILQRQATLVQNKALTKVLYLAEIQVDDIGSALLPGQFVHVGLPGMESHILRRPFSVYYHDPSSGILGVLYQIVGQGTKHFSTLTVGTQLDVLGPIGTPWPEFSIEDNVLLVMGGVGCAPLYLLAQQLKNNGNEIQVIMGAQTKEALVGLKRYSDLLGFEPVVTTDDGTYGTKGFCTDVLDDAINRLKPSKVCCCGPEPMMRAVSEKTLSASIPTFISLEKRMACGIGACLSCVVSTIHGNKRSCVDGPVFDAAEVIW